MMPTEFSLKLVALAHSIGMGAKIAADFDRAWAEIEALASLDDRETLISIQADILALGQRAPGSVFDVLSTLRHLLAKGVPPEDVVEALEERLGLADEGNGRAQGAVEPPP